MEVLTKGQVQVSSVIYPKMSHTDPILENVLAGETYLIDDMTKVIEEKFQASSSSYDGYEEKLDIKNSSYNSKIPSTNRGTATTSASHEAPVMVSRKLIYFARIMNPF